AVGWSCPGGLPAGYPACGRHAASAPTHSWPRTSLILHNANNPSRFCRARLLCSMPLDSKTMERIRSRVTAMEIQAAQLAREVEAARHFVLRRERSQLLGWLIYERSLELRRSRPPPQSPPPKPSNAT